jgi:Transglycosylase SLT domain
MRDSEDDMRHLFLPACLCVMTLSSPAGSDPKLSLGQFTGANTDDVQLAMRVVALSDDKNEQASSDNDDAISDSPAPQISNEALPVVTKPVVSRSSQEICDTLVGAAHSNDLPIPFFIHLLFRESGFKPDVVSRAGAQGIAQFMPETAAAVGLDNPFDPLQAITASARLLRNLVRQFGNVGLAAAAYNAGPKRIQNWLAKKGKLPEETQNYVKIITGRPAEKWTTAARAYQALMLPRDAPCQQAADPLAWNAPERLPAHSASRLRSKAATMIATRARAKTTRRPAIQLAAIGKKNHHKMQLSQR